MKRLEKNTQGYRGETIDIRSVLDDTLHAARRAGWQIEMIEANPTCRLPALHRPAAQPSATVYLSTGIHGDEPAGPLAVRQLLQDDQWPDELTFWLCPCLNPTGFPLNKRENAHGADLNRDYRHLRTDEIRAHISWLNQRPPFDLTLCLHEDWEAHGFYLYELNPDRQPSLAEDIIRRVAEVCPIDPSPEIESRPAQNGIIRPNLDPASRPEWPEAFFLIQHKTRLSYTLEAPSDFPLITRVAALVAAVRAALS